MKRLLLLSLFVLPCASACRAPIVVDENGWPIGFATRQQTETPAQRVPQQGAQAMGTGSGAGPVQSIDGASLAGGANTMADVDPHRVAQESKPQHEAPLLGWNGEVVEDPANRPTQSPPRHGIEPEGGGRMRIIELYQTVLDERDALRDELETVTAALEGAQRSMIDMEEQTKVMQQRILELESASQTMQAENIDLAARLTTAQIRRLEAEKMLLENRIGVLRQGTAQEASADRDPRTKTGGGS